MRSGVAEGDADADDCLRVVAADDLVLFGGADNDGGGPFDEDGVGDLDLHRNYPHNWPVMPEDDATDRNLTQGGPGASTRCPSQRPDTSTPG